MSEQVVSLMDKKFALSRLDYPQPLLYGGVQYSSAWTAYIAQHFDSIFIKKQVSQLSAVKASSYLAKIRGWSTVADVDARVLEEIVRLKFLHKKSRENLLLTNNDKILYGYEDVGFILGCSKDDNLGRGVIGNNILGHIIQTVRDEYLVATEKGVCL